MQKTWEIPIAVLLGLSTMVVDNIADTKKSAEACVPKNEIAGHTINSEYRTRMKLGMYQAPKAVRLALEGSGLFKPGDIDKYMAVFPIRNELEDTTDLFGTSLYNMMARTSIESGGKHTKNGEVLRGYANDIGEQQITVMAVEHLHNLVNNYDDPHWEKERERIDSHNPKILKTLAFLKDRGLDELWLDISTNTDPTYVRVLSEAYKTICLIDSGNIEAGASAMYNGGPNGWEDKEPNGACDYGIETARLSIVFRDMEKYLTDI